MEDMVTLLWSVSSMYVKYTREMLATAVANNTSVHGVMRFLGLKLAGGTHSNISRRIKEFNLDTRHFTGKGSNRGPRHKGGTEQTPAHLLLVKRTSGGRRTAVRLRRALVEAGVEYKCVGCRLKDTWQEKLLILQVNHKNRDWLDDRIENLEFLCPNCHSQSEGWSGSKGGTNLFSSVQQNRNRRVAKRQPR